MEKVYENSLLIELRNEKIICKNQFPIKVYYQNQIVGAYFADIVVNDLIIIELKASEYIKEEHEYQLINYLKATNKEIGLLLNFGRKPEIKRKIFTNEKKDLNTDNLTNDYFFSVLKKNLNTDYTDEHR